MAARGCEGRRSGGLMGAPAVGTPADSGPVRKAGRAPLRRPAGGTRRRRRTARTPDRRRPLRTSRDSARVRPGLPVVPSVGNPECDRPHRSGADVAVEVAPVQWREGRVAHDVATGDRAAARMRVSARPAERDPAPCSSRTVRRPSQQSQPKFAPRPRPAPAGAKSISSQRSLSDVADDEITGLPVEGEAPRVPEAVRPDLVPAGLADERVVGRNGVRPRPLGRCAGSFRAAFPGSGRCRRDLRLRPRRRCRCRGSRQARTGAARRCGCSVGAGS